MAYELDAEVIVVLSEQGSYTFKLNDIVYLLRVEIEGNSHYVFKTLHFDILAIMC